MKFRHLLLAATAALALPGAAMAQDSWLPTAAAQPVTGVYVGAGLGWNHLSNNNMTAKGRNALAYDAAGLSRQGNLDFKEGGVGVLSLGYGFGNGFRVEVEGNYRYNELDKLGGFPGRAPGVNAGSAFNRFSGEVQQYGAMANVYYDFQLPQWFPNMPVAVVPYIGGGVGYLWTDIDARGTRRGAPGETVDINGGAGQFAFQGIAGLSFPIASVPGLAITAEYRYMGALQSKYDGNVRNASGQLVSNGSFEVDQNHNQSVMVGVRYAFNTPRPAAPAPVVPVAPAAAPAPARTYLVFFDFDRADLTDRARQIIAEAAQNANRVQTTRIEVAGHADRSGSPQYNQRLSQRRADAVAAELTRQGIQRSAITVQAFGESRPLVATADGVREPQNRRVEIVLR
ncbi:OmpA family protein [Pseudoroseomonas wenyumeiae]|uniref:OmpA family protein n=1 Tax=Teichococcus wenyumeiae TaxID=2478470 RepID=A0A3A9JLC3_9PROT|nr:OmpA family protein [Pseudoroseomonas wenyumeiae]RKK05573.1 OmpA family protein [Pseudoroseomonas wenyumeiae]RMI19959.1 OmpA family protein [Pseudoroseomonas wenyumeiae]